MEIKEIIRELEYFRGYYPEEALREAVNRQEEITPELIKILEKSIANIAYISESKNNNGFIYAFYLLAQFREKSAFPLITEFFSKLEGNSYNFTGSLVTEVLPRILASVFNGEFSTLNFVSTCDEYDEFVRIAFLNTYLILYNNKIISRDNLIDGYKYIFENLERKKSYIWHFLVDACVKTGITELKDNIKQAYKDNLIDTIEQPYEQAMYKLESGIIEKDSSKYSKFIEDVIEESNWWRCYSRKQEEHSFYVGMPDTAKEIIKDLEYFRGFYPAEALAKAAENKDIIIPELLKILDWTSENPREDEDVDFIGPVFACYLLGQFEEKSAFTTIIRFIKSGSYSHEAFFEFTFLSLGEILASCYNGDHNLLTENILNKEVDEIARSAFLDCLVIIYNYNEIGKIEYFKILKKLFDNLEKDVETLWHTLIEACEITQATELYPEVELVYKEKLIDDYFHPLEETRSMIFRKDEQTPDLELVNKFKIEINSTDWWKRVEMEEPEEKYLSYLDTMKDYDKSRSDDIVKNQIFYDTYQNMQPYVRTGKKIGRNDPCPCGSGKKYKKCCGKNNNE
ncbi:MAG: DUF1186 domain-containing protein [Candidatus Stygibacter frigidus]|nr:DUF1186 domain-containing protein [Candidatus Stygibacter frigidus]